MKKMRIILFAILLMSTSLSAQWVSQWVFTTGDLKCVSYLNANNIYIGTPGYTVKTSNGGLTWQTPQVNDMINQPYSATTLYDYYALSPTTVVASGSVVMANSYAILRTTNGASNWSIEYSSNAGAYPRVFNKFCFTSPTDGYAVGTNGMIVKTLDAGDSWVQQTSGTTAELYCVDFPTSLVGYIGAAGGILKTTNAGSAWAMNSMPGVNIREIWFVSADTGYAAGNSSGAGVFLKTTNGGTTWMPVINPITPTAYSLTGTGYDTLYLGSGNRLFYTTNGGQWWNYFPNMPGMYNDVEFLENSDSAYAVGNGGLAYKTGNGGGTVLAPVSIFAASTATTICVNNTVSFNNYGNPAWSYTWLLDNVPVASTFNATINFNVSGAHNVKLIADNGAFADTSAGINVSVTPLPTVNPITLTSSSYNICPGQGVILQVPNSQSGVSYQILLNGITPVGSPQNGNGGTRSFNVNGITSTSNYQVSGTSTNSCGTTVVYSSTVTITVNAVNQALVVDAVHDTVCSGTPDTIALYNSVAGVSYRLRIGTTVVGGTQVGNGSTLYFPTGNLTAITVFNILGTNTTNCSAQMVTTATVNVIYVQAIIGNTFNFVNTNDTIQFINNSIGTSYVWNFGPSASPSTSTATNPTVVFSGTGMQTIYLDAMGPNGCVSHDTLTVQLIEYPPAGAGTLCMSEDHNIRYSNGNTGYVILDYCVDQNGFSYATGYYDSSWNGSQYNLLIMKFDPSGQLLWEHKQNPFSYSFFNYVSSFGNAITVDSLGNFYVAGSFASTTFAIGPMTFATTSYNNVLRGFVVKFSPAGVPLWKIEGYSTTQGALTGIMDIICKNNNELYLTYLPSYYADYHFTNTTLSGQQDCIGVAKIDANGNLLGTQTANSTSSCNVQMFYNPNISSYNTNRVAYVGPRLELMGDTLYLGAHCTTGMIFGTYTVSAGGSITGMIAKLNTNTMAWTGAFRTFYATSTAFNRRATIPVFTVDYLGNVYWAWQMPPQTFSQTAIVGSTAVSGYQFSFMAKYKPNGSVAWVLPDNSPNVVVSLAAASSGQIVGYAQSPDDYIPNSDFPLLTSTNGTLYGFPSEGYREGFLFSYSNSGNLTWVQRIHGTGNENSMCMTARCDQLYFIGSTDSISILGSDTIAHPASGLFLGKYSAGGNCATPNCTNPFLADITCSDSTVCPGFCTNVVVNTSFVSGSVTYSWSPGNMTTSSVNVCPAATTMFTCTVTDTNGYILVLTQNVIVLTAPNVLVSGDSILCLGGNSVLTATGASTYNWMPGNLSGNSQVFNPSVTTTYVVTGINANGCADTTDYTIVVNSLPLVTLNLNAMDTMCISSSIVALSGGTPAGGIYSGPGVSGDSLFSSTIAGAGLHQISYSYVDSLGCMLSVSDSIYVDLCLTADNLNGEAGLACFPNPAALSLTVKVAPELIGSTLLVRDIRGSIVISRQVSTDEIILDVTNLSTGMYCIQLVGDNMTTQQIVFSKL